MRHGLKWIALLAICAFAPAAHAGFGIKVPKKPKSGDVEKVEDFVKAADVAYTQVRTLSVEVPTQMTDLCDQVMGLKDLPLADGMMEKYTALKGQLMGAVTQVKTTNIGDLKSLQEANGAVDDASKDLVGFMKEVTSTEEIKQALGAADLEAIKAKAQTYVDKDAESGKLATEKGAEAGKKAPEAAKEYTMGVAEDHVIKLSDKSKVTVKQCEGLIKSGGDHAKKWQDIAQKRVATLTEVVGVLGLQ